MPKKSPKAAGEAAAANPRTKLIGRWVGVPTSFFGVEVPGARYLGRVTLAHASKTTMVWVKFAADGNEVFVPHDVAAKWVITDAEANDGSTEWYTVPSDDDESEAESEHNDDADGAQQPG